MTDGFLRRRHAAYQTPERVISGLIRRATGQEAAERQQIALGYDNEVYAVRTRLGEEFIIRIRQHGENNFEQEAWAIEQCRATDVPVPDVLFSTTVSIEGQDREAMVQRKLPGRPLSVLMPTLAPSDMASIFAQAGEALSGIHSVSVGGFWRRHEDGKCDFPTWEQVMESHIQNRRAERPLLVQSGFTDAEIETIYGAIESYKRDFPCRRPVLCHGDFLPAHLFVSDDLVLTGVIDFGEFSGGPPISDFADLYLNHPEVDLAWLQAGYKDKSLFDETFPSRLLMHCAGSQVGYLAHYIREGNSEAAALAAVSLRTTLQEWTLLGKRHPHG